jgi:L-threonylcarbamoyladenylate synthase
MSTSEVNKALAVLENQKILLYPTDTVWGIGCDATFEETVAKVFKIKQRVESKSLVILVDSIEMLKQYIPHIPDAVILLLKTTTDPTTIIYNNPIGLAKNVVSSENTVAIRIVKAEFCRLLIKKFGKPIVSTSANISGNPTPKSYSEIPKTILECVDYIVDLQREEINKKPSTILKLDEQNKIIVLRK